MKQYLLFAGHNYYPSGGWDDFVDSFNSFEEAKKAGLDLSDDWIQVIDSLTGEDLY